MQTFNINDMIKGWFIGDFTPTLYKTSDFEIGLLTRKRSDKADVHIHKKAIEFTLIISGKLLMHDQMFQAGQGFVLEKYEIADPVIIEDCLLMVVKIPSVSSDKFLLEYK